MIDTVVNNHRGQRARPDTIDRLHREKTIQGGLADLNIEEPQGLFEKGARAPDVTGRSHAQGQNILAPGKKGKSLVKMGDPKNFHEGHPQLTGDGGDGIPGDPAVFLLNVLKNLNEQLGLTFSAPKNGVK